MLVHKNTMGALSEIWDGTSCIQANGRRLPVLRPACLADFPELDPNDWWELPGTSPLARRIRRYYPFLRPVVGENGELLDVVILQERENPDKTSLDAEATSCGYQKGFYVRPKMLLPFLHSDT